MSLRNIRVKFRNPVLISGNQAVALETNSQFLPILFVGVIFLKTLNLEFKILKFCLKKRRLLNSDIK